MTTHQIITAKRDSAINYQYGWNVRPNELEYPHYSVVLNEDQIFYCSYRLESAILQARGLSQWASKDDYYDVVYCTANSCKLVRCYNQGKRLV